MHNDATRKGSETGSAGTVLIEAKNISLNNGAMVSAETYGKSKGGSVTLHAEDKISLSDESQIFSGTMGNKTESGAGNAGTVLVEAKNISLSRGSLISSDTYSDAIGGNIIISGKDGEFAESLNIYDSRIYAGATGSGNGGDVDIKGKNIAFADGGSIDSKSSAAGKGGNIRIYASESLSFKNRGEMTASTKGAGNAGSIELEIGSLTLDTDASVSSASESEKNGGNAGTIAVRAEDTISMKNQSVITTSTSGEGAAGAITIDTDDLTLNSGSSISSASKSENQTIQAGDAGTIFIQTDKGINLSGNSAITTEAVNAGKGQIRIESAGGVWLSQGMITNSIRKGEEDAGDIYAGQDYLILNHSRIIANDWEGKGGNIHLIANPFVQSSDSRVNASSELGIDGTVYIEAPG